MAVLLVVFIVNVTVGHVPLVITQQQFYLFRYFTTAAVLSRIEEEKKEHAALQQI